MYLTPKHINIKKDLSYKIITSYRVASLLSEITEYKGYPVVVDRFIRDDVLYIFGKDESNLVITNIADGHALRVLNELDGFIAEHRSPYWEDCQADHDKP